MSDGIVEVRLAYRLACNRADKATERAEKAEATVARQGEALRAIAEYVPSNRRADSPRDIARAALAGSDVPPTHVCADHTVTDGDGTSYCAGCERDAR